MKDAFQFTKFKNCMCLVVVLGACVSMSACQSLGTPVIQLDIDMDVQSSDVPSQKSDVTYVASAPLFPFEWPHYSGKEVEWTFQTHPNGFSIDVKNVGELDVELAWNEARWRSSFQDNWDDFLVYEQFTLLLHKFLTSEHWKPITVGV